MSALHPPAGRGVTPTRDSNLAKSVADEDASTTTSALCANTENACAGDGLPDGKVNFGTTENPVWKGEDLNVNGTRDQDADGNWTETDFLANDSDVDGAIDGAEELDHSEARKKTKECPSDLTAKELMPRCGANNRSRAPHPNIETFIGQSQSSIAPALVVHG